MELSKEQVKHKRNHQRRHHKENNRRLSDKYFYVGVHNTETNIRLIQYNDSSINLHDIKNDVPDFSKLTDNRYINWFQVSGLTDSDVITRIVKECGLHNLDAKDILTPQHIIKIEEYNERLLIILNSCFYNENKELHTEHISIVISGNIFITFTESNNPVFDHVTEALQSNLLNIRKKGVGLLLAFVLNTLISNMAESASKVEEYMEDIEEALLNPGNKTEHIGLEIQERRRDYMVIRKNSLPLKEQFPKIMRSEIGLVTEEMRPVYGDISDQIQYIIQTMEGCRDIISSLVDLYISNNDLRMNAIMKRLTVVSTIFIPLTFLVGVWGMNFDFMPELNWKYGYIMAWGIMAVIGILTWLFMKKEDMY